MVIALLNILKLGSISKHILEKIQKVLLKQLKPFSRNFSKNIYALHSGWQRAEKSRVQTA